MKKQLVTFATLAALGATSLGIYGTSLAANGPQKKGQWQPAAQMQQPKAPCPNMKKMHSPWNLGLQFDKHLTANDAKTLVSAALLMRGRHDLVVGSVETKAAQNNDAIYLVTIKGKKGSAVTTVVVNSKSGHIRPLTAGPQKPGKGPNKA